MAAGEDASVDDQPAGHAGSWQPIGFGNPDGDVVECWACPLPAGFVERLEGDVEALRVETAEGAASGRGVLVEANRVTVDGRPALRRIVRLPAGVISSAVYVAEQVVPVGDEVGLEITVSCGALSDPLAGSFGRRQRPQERQRLPREVRVGGKVGTKTPRLGLAAARERAGHTQATLAAAVGVLTQTVSYWETGAKGPRARYRSPLAMALGISLEDLDRLIRGEAFHPPGVTQIAGPGAEHWVMDVACLPRRPYSEVPLPATALMFSAASSEDGLSRARRILAEISPAIRIIAPTAAPTVGAARTRA
jgi:DNA-binding XRE family transcriptional regulator